VTIQYLRDGLYQACQAYANGAITSTAYSVILGHIDETLATTMMAEAAAGTVPDVNAAIGAWATSTGDAPSGASGPGAADQSQATAPTAGSGESGGANPAARSTVPARTNQTAGVDLPPPTTLTVTPNAGVAAEIARMHTAFLNDPGLDSLMHACVSALDRPKTGSATSETELARICQRLVSPDSLQEFGATNNRRIIALAALELASSQARALEAAARVCAQDAKHENCKALRAALPSGAKSAALLHEVLSYAKEDTPTSARRDVTAARQHTPVKAAYRQ
jgi:hypothetical protein